MDSIPVGNSHIKARYRRSGTEKSPLNPGFIPQKDKSLRYKMFNEKRIFYIIKPPTAVGGYKLGKAGTFKGDSSGGRLRSYFNAYGYAPGFWIEEVIVLKGRGKSKAGEKGKEGRWAESKFENQVLNYLKKEMNVEPIRDR